VDWGEDGMIDWQAISLLVALVTFVALCVIGAST
jgi:hypothetical protein